MDEWICVGEAVRVGSRVSTGAKNGGEPSLSANRYWLLAAEPKILKQFINAVYDAQENLVDSGSTRKTERVTNK